MAYYGLTYINKKKFSADSVCFSSIIYAIITGYSWLNVKPLIKSAHSIGYASIRFSAAVKWFAQTALLIMTVAAHMVMYPAYGEQKNVN